MSTLPPGDSPCAFACLLYKRHRRDLLSYLQARGVQARDLEDALQEVIKGACDSRDTRDEGRSLEGWLFGIAANVAGHYLRSPCRRWEELATSEEGTLDSIPDVSPGPEDLLMRRDRTRMLDEMVAAVKPERRDIFVKHKREDVPLEEVARIHGITPKTAWARSRAAFAECTGWLRRWRSAEKGKGREGEAVILPLSNVEGAARRTAARSAPARTRSFLARGALAVFGLSCISPRSIPQTASDIRPLIVTASSLASAPPSLPAEHAAADTVPLEAPPGAGRVALCTPTLPESAAPDGGSTLDSDILMLQAAAEQRIRHYEEATRILVDHTYRFPDGPVTARRNGMLHGLDRPVSQARR